MRSTIPYIPVHLDYMLYELLKNSMRAVVERHRGRPALPPIVMHIAGAPREVTVRISDQGGGIEHDLLDRVWRYGYTTINQSPGSRYHPRHCHSEPAARCEHANACTQVQNVGTTQLLSVCCSEASASLPLGDMQSMGGHFRMGGLGFGLPMSRLYARYFGEILGSIS